jgi:hypothetical protein
MDRTMTTRAAQNCLRDIARSPNLALVHAEHTPGKPSTLLPDGRRTFAVPESYLLVVRDRTTGKDHVLSSRDYFLRLARRKGWRLLPQETERSRTHD